MLRNLLVLTFTLVFSIGYSQEKVTLNGYVKDADNGEELIGVTVYIPELKAGAVTNAYGFYSITLPRGTYEIQFSYIGYKFQTIKKELSRSEEHTSELQSRL